MITFKAEIDLQALVDIQVLKINVRVPTLFRPPQLYHERINTCPSGMIMYFISHFFMYIQVCERVCVGLFQLVCVLGDELDSISQTIRKCRFMCRCHLSVPLYEGARKDGFAIG